MHLRVQLGRRHRRQRAVAAVRSVRGRAERESDPRLGHLQVQGVRLRDDDQLRGGGGRHPVAERLRARRPSAPSQLQNQQEQILSAGRVARPPLAVETFLTRGDRRAPVSGANLGIRFR